MSPNSSIPVDDVLAEIDQRLVERKAADEQRRADLKAERARRKRDRDYGKAQQHARRLAQSSPDQTTGGERTT